MKYLIKSCKDNKYSILNKEVYRKVAKSYDIRLIAKAKNKSVLKLIKYVEKNKVKLFNEGFSCKYIKEINTIVIRELYSALSFWPYWPI